MITNAIITLAVPDFERKKDILTLTLLKSAHLSYKLDESSVFLTFLPVTVSASKIAKLFFWFCNELLKAEIVL